MSRLQWRRIVASVIVLGLLGCQTAAPPGSPNTTVTKKDKQLSSNDDLNSRPLYTFTEAELDRYLPIVHAVEPELTQRVVRLGRQNIGQPYEMYLLGEFPFEFHDPDPIYCLSRSDCLTFCENTYAMALSTDWWSYLRTLQRLRYRDGTIGMLTRNHYTEADWDRNNAYLFDDLTAKLGGGRACVPMHEIIKRAPFFAKFQIGQDIPDESFEDFYIPKENVPKILNELHNGDFVNIVRGDASSQYVGHTGLIALAADGTPDFLHSTSPKAREQPLIQYLQANQRCLGIRILRLRPDAERIMTSVLAASPKATPVDEASLCSALAASPLLSTGAPPSYAKDWPRAMRLQSCRLTYDTPVDSEFQATIETLDRQIGGKYEIPEADRAFGVLDVRDLRLALVHPDAMFYGASVPKICIVMAYFDSHPDAIVNLDPQIEHELQRVIKRSDNELASKYSQIVGLDKIQQMLTSDRYRFYDKDHGGGLWCGKHYGLEQPRIGDPLMDHSHAATVRQCLRYYLMLEQGQLVNAATCAKLKRIFAAPDLEFHDENFVQGLNGRDVAILRKSGLWEDWHLDTARVQHGDRVYLLAGMVHHPKGQDYLAEMAAAVDEALCGIEPRKLFTHRLILHESSEDFKTGSFDHAQPDEHDAGVKLICTSADGAGYESPILEPGVKFNKVVASWNVDTPSQSGFAMEIRVGRKSDGVWSPYLYIGDWGDVTPTGEKVVDCDLGKIDVDFFKSTERFDRVQYRLRAVSAGDGETVVNVRRIAICVSDTTGIPTSVFTPSIPVERPASEQWQRRLPVPFRSQKTDDPDMKGKTCSPTSVAMVLAYRGVDRPTDDVAQKCFDPVHQIYGNWPRNVQAAYSLGVPGYLTRFSDWAEVERMIASGQPLVISIHVDEEDSLRNAPYRTTDGHLIVLMGFDSEGRALVNDPAVTDVENSERAYYREDLEKVWMHATDGLTYVLLPVPQRRTD